MAVPQKGWKLPVSPRRSPYCDGSGRELALEVPPPAVSIKRATCPVCGHIVVVERNKLVRHWWPHERHSREV